MKFILLPLCALALLTTSQAHASPSLTFDASYLEVTAKNEGSHSSGYSYDVRVRARVFGDVEKGDILKFKVKRGGKVLTKLRCKTYFFNAGSRIPDPFVEANASRCSSNKAGLTVDGTLTVEASYVRDSDESEHALGSFDVQVLKYPKIVEFDRKKKAFKRTPVFQVAPIDQMGLGYAWFKPWSGIKDAGQVSFYFWAPLNQHLDDTDFRCTRGGKTVLRIADARWSAVDKIRQHSEYGKKVKGEQERIGFDYDWKKIVIMTSREMAWGTGTARGWSKPEFVLTPGDYVCKFRSEGETVREFHFSIGPDHKPVLHPLQASGDLPMGPNRFLMDIRFPKENSKEWCFPSKQIKKSVWFGRKWPAASRKSLKALPSAKGDCRAK